MYTENTIFFWANKRKNVFFQDINRRDVAKMRDDVVPRISPIWEKTIHVSVCFTSYSRKNICIVLTVQGSRAYAQPPAPAPTLPLPRLRSRSRAYASATAPTIPLPRLRTSSCAYAPTHHLRSRSRAYYPAPTAPLPRLRFRSRN